VKALCSTTSAFAAIVGDDSAVVCWGDKGFEKKEITNQKKHKKQTTKPQNN